ncbi:hypothetical protein [Roseicyclus sp.]|uniref:hypothetical protein n=1 Tax=Roseicyclus sp. TaxID=1914329 RepID=UPI002638DC49|nr:hypothetical protein [Roseicyclus sp.]
MSSWFSVEYLVIGRHPHIGDGRNIPSGFVAFVNGVVSTGIQIRFSYSALFGFLFFHLTRAGLESRSETGNLSACLRSVLKSPLIISPLKSVVFFSNGKMTCRGQNRLSPFSWFFNCLTKKRRGDAREDGHSCAENGHICAPGRKTNRLSGTAIAIILHEELDDTHRATVGHAPIALLNGP